MTIWLTGLPSAGKSTIALKLKEMLEARGQSPVILDGDEVRERLSKGLGFSKADRDENVRRIAYVARLLTGTGAVVVVAAISPYRAGRDEARAEIRRFAEIHVHCPLEECVRRDVKGLYRKAIGGALPHFTGVSDPYEAPLSPELRVETHRETPQASAERILDCLQALGYMGQGEAIPMPVETLAPIQQESEA
ncbi:MAG TPA: adenylyl-sulfate kinase [Candidatus Polarisedimenticolia bacterium]|nr:adenylyl-sulfate kinase [Candidatus Polarisedimenticolia bacterium]